VGSYSGGKKKCVGNSVVAVLSSHSSLMWNQSENIGFISENDLIIML
jgi:hypothetical protein